MIIAIVFTSAFVSAAAPTLPIAWGFATSAYQIEGAWNQSGKGPSVWDKWYLDPSRAGNPNGFIADDHYNRMPSDIAYLGQLGATSYRFSVSWPRIYPNCSGTPNAAGLKFYSDMIDEILKNGATPLLTMFHWDTPQACHDQYGSWRSPNIVQDFTNYADTLISNYGDRVKYFLTINEPGAFCGFGYEQAYWPPGLNLGKQAQYDCIHLVNLAHGSAVTMARSKYASKGLKFGMPLIVNFGVPYTNAEADITATNVFLQKQTDWNWGPLTGGDYPAYLKQSTDFGPYLPVYTPAQQAMMKGTLDFLGLNYYSANYISGSGASVPPIGPVSGTSWQNLYPVGIRGLTKWASSYYNGMDVFVTECGTSVPNELNLKLDEIIDDTFRQDFFSQIVSNLTEAVLVDKTPIKAFLAWALLDNFEWNTYDQVFGMIGIDRQNGTLTRNVKNSAKFLSNNFATSKSPLQVLAPSVGTAGSAATGPTGSNANGKSGASTPFVSALLLVVGAAASYILLH